MFGISVCIQAHYYIERIDVKVHAVVCFNFVFCFSNEQQKNHSNVSGLGIYSRPWLGCLSWMLWVECVCVCARECAFLLFRIQPLAVNIYLLLLLLFCCRFLLDKMIWRFSALSVSDNHASTDMSICICNIDSVYVCERGRGRDPMRCDVICLKLQTHVCTRSRTRNVLKSIFK